MTNNGSPPNLCKTNDGEPLRIEANQTHSLHKKFLLKKHTSALKKREILMLLRTSFALVIFSFLVVACSPSKAEPTQDTNAIFTQAVETALAAVLTSQPTMTETSIPNTSTAVSTITPSYTNTPLSTNTPRPPSFEVGITSCEVDTSSAYSGWNIYNCGFWVKNNTSQTMTFDDFLKRNNEKLENENFYEQEDFLKPISNSDKGIYITTSENVSYPADFLSFSEYPLIQPLRPNIPVHGYSQPFDDGTFNLHFLIPEAMQALNIVFPNTKLTLNIPQPGIIQAIPMPQIEFANAFIHKNSDPKINITFREFGIKEFSNYKEFSIKFDATNKDKTTQVSSEISFPYYIFDSNGYSYDDVQRVPDKIVILGPYSLRLGPGQTDEFAIEFRVKKNPQFIYIAPINPNEPVIRVDTNNPQANSAGAVQSPNNSSSEGNQCNNFTSQLQPNMDAKVVTDAINMRENPGTNQTIVGIIYAGEKVSIYNEASICSEGYIWWKIKAINSGVTGWVVEGTATERWLSP